MKKKEKQHLISDKKHKSEIWLPLKSFLTQDKSFFLCRNPLLPHPNASQTNQSFLKCAMYIFQWCHWKSIISCLAIDNSSCPSLTSLFGRFCARESLCHSNCSIKLKRTFFFCYNSHVQILDMNVNSNDKTAFFFNPNIYFLPSCSV